MGDQFLFTIATSFISLLLIVNAYFTRETLLRVVKIEVKLEQNSVKQSYTEREANYNTEEIKRLRDRVNSLESYQAQFIGFIEDNKNS